MAKTNILIFNAAVRHQIYLQRYAGSQANKLRDDLLSMKKQVLHELRNPDLKLTTKKNKEQFLASLNKTLGKDFRTSQKELEGALASLSTYEAEFYKKLIDANLKDKVLVAVPKRTITDAVFKKAFIFSETEKMTIGTALTQFSTKKQAQLLQTVKDGFTNNQSIPELTKAINEVVLTKQIYQATALARTLVQQVVTHSRQALYDNNSDVIDSMRWASVLDGRTTPECQALDGQILDIDSRIQPGFHWNCRSTTVPVINPKYNLASNAIIERAARDENGKTVSVDGKVTYNSWLKTQSAEFQNEILGETKGALFRDGELNLNQFVDENYRPYTLDELRNLDDADVQRAFNKIDSN